MKKLNNVMNSEMYTVLEASSSGLVLLNQNLIILDCNQSFLNIYGCNNIEEYIGESINNLFIKKEVSRIKEIILPEVKKNKFWTGEMIGKKFNNTKFIQKLSISVCREDNYICLVNIKDEIPENEGQYSSLFSKLNVGLFKILPGGECINVNPGLLEMFDYNSKSQIESDNFFKELYQVIKYDQDKYVIALRKKGGELIWTKIKSWENRDEKNNILYYEGIINDITNEQHMWQVLKKTKRKYRAFFKNTGTAVLVIKEDTSISMVNDKMVELSGYAKEELEGRMSWMQLIAEDEELELILKYHNQRRYSKNKDKVPQTYQCKLKTKEGTIKHIIANVVFLTNSLESVVSLIDISDQKQYEKKVEFLAYHDQLTGLYNRNYFEKKIVEFDRNKFLPLSIIMGDVNGLKLVNDAFGHKKGDELLQIIADALKKACRLQDTITRWGGDEFLIILPNTDYNSANQVRNKIQQYCIQIKTELIQPSIALGIATKTDVDQEINDIIKKAERWVYKNKLVESNSVRSSVIKTLEETLLEKDYETEEHAQRLKKLVLKMGTALNLTNEKIDDLILLAGLHDIGKIAVNEEILLKSGPLTEKEWELIKKHSEIGYRIAKASPELSSIAEGILYHHEWWDGSGYPAGLKDKEIPLISRIISIIDAYDVMIHKRTYKDAISSNEAIEELKRCAGIQFDPELVRIFIDKVIDIV